MTKRINCHGVVWAARLALVIVAASITLESVWAEPVPPATVRVIDGDTIDVRGELYRLVGFDTPETWEPRCAYERALGETATARLVELVGSGGLVELIVLPGRDRYDRGLARLFIGGADVKDMLIAKGLARTYNGGRRAKWC